MRDFERKQTVRKARHMMFSLPVLVVLGAVTAFMFLGTWHIYQKVAMTRQNLQKVTVVYDALYKRENELAASVEALKTPFGVETEIRGKFGFVKEGEEMVVLVDDLTKKSENDEVTKEKSWWQKVKDIF